MGLFQGLQSACSAWCFVRGEAQLLSVHSHVNMEAFVIHNSDLHSSSSTLVKC